MPNQVAWITGASTGIGFELAKAFAKAGYTIIATARRKSRLVSLVNEIRFAGHEAYAFVCDVTSERSVLSTRKKILEKCRSIDVLVNNAGVTVYKNFIETKTYDYDNIIDTNLRGCFVTTKAVLPLMIKRKRGHIINLASIASKTVFTGSAVYSASKAGIIAMSNVLRAEVRKFNIKVSNILPGATDTPMWSPSSRQRYSTRMMTPREVADIVVQVANQPKKVVMEDVIIKPIKGDL
ncbi:MAG TPA: SDR family oxidoreductase [Ignavibacteria bacterium]|nr:SDR family oxidoreductase [Ignavibacteria bacterium]